jgi:hypothetical protein
VGKLTINDFKQNLKDLILGKADKDQVLTNVPLGAEFTDTIYTHPVGAGNNHIPTGGTVGQILKNTASGTATWQAEAVTTIVNNLTETVAGKALDAKQGKIIDDKIYSYAEQVNLGFEQLRTLVIGFDYDLDEDLTLKGVIEELNNKTDKSQVLTNVPSGAKFTDTLTTINGKTGIITKADITALGVPDHDTKYEIATGINNGLVPKEWVIDSSINATAIYDENNNNSLDMTLINMDNASLAHARAYELHIPYSITTGSANTYSIPLSIPSLVAGMAVSIKINIASTGPSTLNWDNKGAKAIKKTDGSNVTNLKEGGVYTLRYDGVSFQLQGEGGEYGTALAQDILIGKTIGTENGIISGTIPIKSAATIIPTAVPQTIAAGQYLSGIQTISGVVVPTDKVLIGTTIAGQSGTIPIHQTFTTSPDFHAYGTGTADGGNNIYVQIPKGYSVGGNWLAYKDANLIPVNIKKGIGIGGGLKTIGTYTGEGNATAGQVLSGIKFSTASLSNATGTMPNNGAISGTIATQGGSIVIPAGYTTGGTISASFANLTPPNIKAGINIGNVVGTLEAKSVVVAVSFASTTATTATTPVLPSRPSVIILQRVQISDNGQYSKSDATGDIATYWNGSSYETRTLKGAGTWWGDGGSISVNYYFTWSENKINISNNVATDKWAGFGSMKVVY